MKKSNKSPEVVQQLIIQHTKLNISIRKKLKVMIRRLPVPDPIEKTILDFIGMPAFTSF